MCVLSGSTQNFGAELVFPSHLLIQYIPLRIIVKWRSYSVVLLSVTRHTGSKGGLEKLVLQTKFCVEPDKTHNRGDGGSNIGN